MQFLLSLRNANLRTRRFNRPTFRLTRPTDHWKNTAFRDFSNISRVCIFFHRTVWLLHLLSTDLTSTDLTALLLFNSPYCRKFLVKLPSIKCVSQLYNLIALHTAVINELDILQKSHQTYQTYHHIQKVSLIRALLAQLLPGFNTYSASSELGTRVVVLQRGAAFGETGQPKDGGRWNLPPPSSKKTWRASWKPHHLSRCIYETLEIMG